MIKAVIFDIDDTLYAYKPLHEQAMGRVSAFVCEKFEISEDIFYEAFQRAKQETKNRLKNTASEHNRILYFQKMLEYLHVNPFSFTLELYDLYWNYFLENMELENGCEALLKSLKENGIKIGICTDLTAHIQHRKIRALNLTPYLNAIVTSEEAGREKPASAMFHMILKKLNVLPDETVYIGDSFEKDILGAKNVGLKTIWYSKEKHDSMYCASTMEEIGDIIYELQHH